MTQNLKAFLDMLAHAEIGPALLAVSDNGYNVLVGSTAGHPVLFTSYADHPRRLAHVRTKKRNQKTVVIPSTAAGRYQILQKNFDHYRRTLHLPDFSPASQDAIAIQLIRECKAENDINAGNVESAITKCRSRWASLPGAGYDQPERKMADLIAAYRRAGGTVAE